jgi:hypothetical protein
MAIKNLIILACIFSSCAKAPEHVKKCDEVTKEFAKKMQNEEGFSILGVGGIYGKTTVDQLYVDFELDREVSIEEARELLQSFAKKFISHINQKKEFSKYLRISPISAKEISMSIAFIGKDRVPKSEIAQVDLYNQEITFSTYQKKEKQYLPIEKEPFFCDP